jgi:transposase
VRRLLLREPGLLSAEQRCFVDALCENDEVARAYHLAQAFATIARQRHGEELEAWVVNALASGIAERRGFVGGLQRDWKAVRAGVTLPWSNGQTEGQITRLKLIKRQMYGRANFDLLRLRVLHRSHVLHQN